MKAYRINLIGTNNSYLVTERQKPAVEQAVEQRTQRFIKIGGDLIQTSSVKSITVTNVDVDCCPDYFQRQVKAELTNNAPKEPGYRKLPTDWLILNLEGKIIATDIAKKTVERIAKALLQTGDPDKDTSLRFLVAKCHFKIGPDEQRQYFTGNDQIAEAFRCYPDASDPSNMIVRQIYRYGRRQW